MSNPLGLHSHCSSSAAFFWQKVTIAIVCVVCCIYVFVCNDAVQKYAIRIG